MMKHILHGTLPKITEGTHSLRAQSRNAVRDSNHSLRQPKPTYTAIQRARDQTSGQALTLSHIEPTCHYRRLLPFALQFTYILPWVLGERRTIQLYQFDREMPSLI